MKQLLVLLVVLLAVAVSPRAQVDDIQNLKHLYDYDSTQPLDMRDSLMYEENGVRVHDISYASPRSGRVTGYLVEPAGKGPFAAILFGHWGPGTRTEFLPEATLYAQAGAVCLMIDNPWVRPTPWRRSLQGVGHAAADHDLYTQAVVDLRRGIDLLTSRPDVDPGRFAYVGHSYGAQWGAVLSAVDDRVKAAVLMGGIPDLSSIYLESDEPDIVEFRASTPADTIQEYLRVNADVDAIHYVPYAAPTPLLFQFAEQERYFNESAMNRYAKAASEPKQVLWYHTGHELNDVQALLDRSEWLHERIGIAPVAQLLQRRLKQR